MKTRHRPILSPSECSILSALLPQTDGMSATQLSEHSRGKFSRPVLYVLLGRLALCGYVRGVRAGQSVIYRITAPGRRVRERFAEWLGLEA
jgi:DNA-binding PadR family transcriptional regulator